MATPPAGARKPTDRKKPQTAAQRRKAEEAAGTYFAGNLNGQTVRVTHPQTWRASSMQALNVGHIFGWAQQNVHPEDMKAFQKADPNGAEMGQFIADVYTHFGADQGE